MGIIVTALHILACLFLIVVVLLQTGKGADVGAVFGGSSQTIFGSSGAGNLLTRLTTWTAAAFMLTSLFLTWNSTQGLSRSIVDTIPSEPPPIAAPVEPAAKAVGDAATGAAQAVGDATGKVAEGAGAAAGAAAAKVAEGASAAKDAAGAAAGAAAATAKSATDAATAAAAGMAGVQAAPDAQPAVEPARKVDAAASDAAAAAGKAAGPVPARSKKAAPKRR